LLLCGCALCRWPDPPSIYREGAAARAFDFTRPGRAAIARRAFLSAGAAAIAAGVLPASANAAQRRLPIRPQILRIAVHNLTTNERLAGVLSESGVVQQDTVAALHQIMRDQRQNAQTAMDTRLFEILGRIHMRVRAPLNLVSGYRTEQTNEMLRARDPVGVARHSLHIQGRAADFAVGGLSAAQLGQIARNAGAGGVGVYASGFVHVDTGPERSWVYGAQNDEHEPPPGLPRPARNVAPPPGLPQPYRHLEPPPGLPRLRG
jgi:uncharacterized protein YcbK (DUF882 family)